MQTPAKLLLFALYFIAVARVSLPGLTATVGFAGLNSWLDVGEAGWGKKIKPEVFS